MKLEITKEKVLQAAKECADAKKVLKTLFPECFDLEYEEHKIYIYRGASSFYKLQSLRDGVFVWAWLGNCVSWANGSFPSAERALQSVEKDKVNVFDNTKQMAEFIVKN